VPHVLELDLRISDEEAVRANIWVPGSRELQIDVKTAVDPNLDSAVCFRADFEFVELALLVFPASLLGAVFFGVLADDQKGACACATADNAPLRVFVVLVFQSVVEADEVVLVFETEHHARVVVVFVVDIDGEVVVEGSSHEVFVDEPVATGVASGLIPVAALVLPVTAFADASVATVAAATLSIVETTLLKVAERGCNSRFFHT